MCDMTVFVYAYVTDFLSGRTTIRVWRRNLRHAPRGTVVACEGSSQ